MVTGADLAPNDLAANYRRVDGKAVDPTCWTMTMM